MGQRSHQARRDSPVECAGAISSPRRSCTGRRLAILPTPARFATALLGVIAAGALAACGSSSSTTPTTGSASLAVGCRAVNAADQAVKTRTYVFLLHVGNPEKMLMISPQQAKSRHIISGELMVGGSMAGMSADTMKSHMATHHLEVHICDRASGKVVGSAMPSITVAPSSGGPPEHLSVAVMEGIQAGIADLHYGNNVTLRPGANYTITVRLGADRAAFKYTAPRGT
jgi:hypothetical protein